MKFIVENKVYNYNLYDDLNIVETKILKQVSQNTTKIRVIFIVYLKSQTLSLLMLSKRLSKFLCL